MFAPRKTEPERQHAAPASSLRERRQAPAPDQPGQARMMQAPPTPVVRNQFNASVGGGRSHIHHDNDGFSHQEPECSPPTRQQRPIRRRKWGFGSTRRPVTACRRRVEPLDGANPPDIHIQAVEMSCNRTPQPAPRHAAHERRTHARIATSHICAPLTIKQISTSKTATD